MDKLTKIGIKWSKWAKTANIGQNWQKMPKIGKKLPKWTKGGQREHGDFLKIP